ncbi:MAG: prepilin-type N-terminal cleavage/methylation domain-containing protein [Pseudomonadota bacterium]
MKGTGPNAGFTVVEMVCAIAVIAILSGTYFFMIDSYRDRRMSEQAAKVLMLAAQAQEKYFSREHRYFDTEVTGNGTDVYVVTPNGERTSVLVPPNVVLSLKSRGVEKVAFTGHAFYTGSALIHKYDSATGKMQTVPRRQDSAE